MWLELTRRIAYGSDEPIRNGHSFVCWSECGGSPKQSPNNNPPVSIPNSETLSITSRQTGTEYQILVALPEGYADGGEKKRYSVVYLLDANFYFGTITEFIRVENLVQEISPLIVVGIGYPENPLDGRVNDMLLNPDSFLGFVSDELIPLIDKTYRTKTDSPDRALMGHSLGGQFVLYTLFKRPELFRRYVAASPSSPNWGDIPPLETKFAQENTTLQASLFMSAGENELALSPIREMFTTIEDRNYDGLEITFMLIPAASHGSSSIPAFTYGLRYVYDATTTPM
ncbi:MAG: alpha/beta hydrolase-fold protein [Anaerolineae bacterium]